MYRKEGRQAGREGGRKGRKKEGGKEGRGRRICHQRDNDFSGSNTLRQATRNLLLEFVAIRILPSVLIQSKEVLSSV